MIKGPWKVETDNNGTIILTMEANHRTFMFELTIDGARKIGDALCRASQYEGSKRGVKLGDYVATH